MGGHKNVPQTDEQIKLPYNTCLCPVDIQKLVDKLQIEAVSDGLNVFFGSSVDNVHEEHIIQQWFPNAPVV